MTDLPGRERGRKLMSSVNSDNIKKKTAFNGGYTNVMQQFKYHQ